MNVLLTGASGFIGSAILARLQAEGHRVRAVMRKRPPYGVDDVVALDMAAARQPEDWLPHLAGIDAVVNCAGVLQDSPRDSTTGVHETGAAALFAACAQAGVRRVIHFSAIGVDRGALSAFSRSKLAGDEALMAQDLDWVILRPSVVVGRAAYGGSALFRGLAALPILPVMPGGGELQIVQREEVAETVLFFLQPQAPARLTLELAGPERLSLPEVIRAYRRWLGWPPARETRVPEWAANLLYFFGDLAGLLGWRTPMRRTAQREMTRGAVGDPSEWVRLTGATPRSLAAALAAEPASVQERWFAGLYFLKPVIFLVFALFWIMTGIVSVGPGFGIGTNYMEAAGMAALAGPGVIAGGIADILVGGLILYRPTTRLGLWAALGLSAFYVVAGTALLPVLWIDPLGPFMKIWPIIVLNLVAFAILEDR